MTFAVIVLWIKVNLRRCTFNQVSYISEPISMSGLSAKDLHGKAIRNGHNKGGTYPSFGRGGEGIGCPTPII